ncbi:hypothetical protein DICA3_B10044 [Diutina catenulata]
MDPEANVGATPDEPVAKRAKVDKPAGEPVYEAVGGSSVRQYLNQHLTQHLLEGLNHVSQQQPDDPLAFLGQFLLQRSKELADTKST